MALIYTHEYFQRIERENERRFKRIFVLIYVQLIIILAALSLHNLDMMKGFEFNFGPTEIPAPFGGEIHSNSTIEYGNNYLIDGFMEDHYQTGRTLIDITIASYSHDSIKYRCSVYNLGSIEKELPEDRGAYRLDCW